MAQFLYEISMIYIRDNVYWTFTVLIQTLKELKKTELKKWYISHIYIFFFVGGLYGYLQEKEQQFTEAELEVYLANNAVKKSKKWIKVINGKPQMPYDVTLCTYVRNQIHHPENTNNQEYTFEELRESTELLITVLTWKRMNIAGLAYNKSLVTKLLWLPQNTVLAANQH